MVGRDNNNREYIQNITFLDIINTKTKEKTEGRTSYNIIFPTDFKLIEKSGGKSKKTKTRSNSKKATKRNNRKRVTRKH
jgi:hypothetical protein